MSRTKRIYNSEQAMNNPYFFYHPYMQVCMGNCHYCKNHNKYAKTRTSQKQEIERDIALSL
jgi:hypothetical protein